MNIRKNRNVKTAISQKYFVYFPLIRTFFWQCTVSWSKTRRTSVLWHIHHRLNQTSFSKLVNNVSPLQFLACMLAWCLCAPSLHWLPFQGNRDDSGHNMCQFAHYTSQIDAAWMKAFVKDFACPNCTNTKGIIRKFAFCFNIRITRFEQHAQADVCDHGFGS